MEKEEAKPVVLLPWSKPDPLAPPRNQVKAAFADRYLNHLEQLNLNSPSRVINLTNIMGTVTEKNNNTKLIKDMLKNNVNILRIPTHSIKLHNVEKILKNIKLAIEEVSLEKCMVVTCAIAIETKGAQMRTGKLCRPSKVGEGDNDHSVKIEHDASIVLTSDSLFENKGTAKRIYVDSPELTSRVLPDDMIFLDGRNIQLKVVEKEHNSVHCIVIKAGRLKDNQIITVPGVTFNIPVIAERDKLTADLAAREGIDFIIISSTRHAEPIKEMKELLENRVDRILIIAKIDNVLSLEYLDEIIANADGVLLDRVSLTAACSVDATFVAQKMIAAKCNKQGKPFLVAGYIEEHSDYNDVTSGDINDIGSIVQDGADVVMLNDSEHEHLVIDVMKTVLRKAESVLWEKQLYEDLSSLASPPLDPAHSIVVACIDAALKCQAVAIIVVTCSGYSAKLVARYRPQCPILAVSSLGYVCKHLNMYRNIKPLHYIKNPQPDWAKDVDCRVQFAIQHGMEMNIICPGDPLILINGWRKGAGFTNIMRVVYAPIE
ncbi:hypothetical protein WDU94_005134 [Cyamophila willieti]